MGTTHGVNLQLFYNNALNDNMGQLINAENILLDDTLGLSAFLSTFNPENNAEQNMQTVLEIYEATYGMQPEEFTQDQIDILLGIALQSPISGGDAVYLARGLLHLDVDDIIDENNQRKSELANAQITEDVITLYPNPAYDIVTIDLNGTVTDAIEFKLYNTLNKEVLYKTTNSSNGKPQINISSLADGIYYYTVRINGVKTFKGKISVIH